MGFCFFDNAASPRATPSAIRHHPAQAVVDFDVITATATPGYLSEADPHVDRHLLDPPAHKMLAMFARPPGATSATRGRGGQTPSVNCGRLAGALGGTAAGQIPAPPSKTGYPDRIAREFQPRADASDLRPTTSDAHYQGSRRRSLNLTRRKDFGWVTRKL